MNRYNTARDFEPETLVLALHLAHHHARVVLSRKRRFAKYGRKNVATALWQMQNWPL